jgi:hypothetical protein
MFLGFHGGDSSDLVLWVVTPCCLVTFEAWCSCSLYILFEKNWTISKKFLLCSEVSYEYLVCTRWCSYPFSQILAVKNCTNFHQQRQQIRYGDSNVQYILYQPVCVNVCVCYTRTHSRMHPHARARTHTHTHTQTHTHKYILNTDITYINVIPSSQETQSPIVKSSGLVYVPKARNAGTSENHTKRVYTVWPKCRVAEYLIIHSLRSMLNKHISLDRKIRWGSIKKLNVAHKFNWNNINFQHLPLKHCCIYPTLASMKTTSS